MGFLDLKYDTFGLDINDLSLKIVKLKKQHKGFGLDSFNEIKIAPGIIEDGVIKEEDILAKIIKSSYGSAKGGGIKTKYVVASLPEEKSFLQVIQMPKMTPEELKTAVSFEEWRNKSSWCFCNSSINERPRFSTLNKIDNIGISPKRCVNPKYSIGNFNFRTIINAIKIPYPITTHG